jgi:large subunit ribosomal protein L17
MRHLKRTAKLGRTSEHRQALLANMVCSLIKARRITTTLAKARAARPVAEKMMTLAKRGTLHARRLASSRLLQDEEAVRTLFKDLAPAHRDRHGGYTRIVKLHQRQGDAASLAILEWVEGAMPTTLSVGEASVEQPAPLPSATAPATPGSQ